MNGMMMMAFRGSNNARLSLESTAISTVCDDHQNQIVGYISSTQKRLLSTLSRPADNDPLRSLGHLPQMRRMDVKELRAIMDGALRQEGLEERRLFPKGLKAWILPGGDIFRCFWPHATRSPWGFSYSGAIGIEIPALRQWLREFKPNEAGIFHSCFVSYVTMNEDWFPEFMLEHGRPVPSDLWAGLLKDRLEKVPSTLDGLIASYRRGREELGWLAHPHERHAWDFLLKWHENPAPSIHVPRMLPDGRVV